ncbi:MAG: hypothetical protein HY313_02160 [Acidobacteria bacterium]|nr:hypothetical protein [Acidobacteriota bacterium]
MPVLLLLLGLTISPGLRAQTFNSGGTAALGDFLNPSTVAVPATSPTDTCDYSTMKIDMNLGVVKVTPVNSASVACVSVAEQTYPLSLVFSATTLPSSFPDGVFEVSNFTLQSSQVGTRAARGVTLNFLSNADNTPVFIRATGDATINAGNAIALNGVVGTTESGTGGSIRGRGELGGPGGYRGGDGGNGGIAPTPGGRGFGPGGGAGGGIGGAGAGAQLLTTGTTIAGTPIPAGNDLLLMLRGGSGGGGNGGFQNGTASDGGGGGGGAILIAASATITVNGAINADGAIGGCCHGGSSSRGGGGSGGVIRLVAASIVGSGSLTVSGGGIGFSAAFVGANGIVRLEALSLGFTGSVTSNSFQYATSPGQVVLPSEVPAFIRFSSITDSDNPANTVTADAAAQTRIGRTGFVSSPDVTMPNASGTPNSVIVDFVVGPNTTAKPFPSGKTVTLVVGPVETSLGSPATYTASVTCPSPPADCTATFTGVTLPRGLSAMTAFTVVDLGADGQLARLFPKEYEGEEIESVRIETNGSDSTYVLIARSGKEFPYKPGR